MQNPPSENDGGYSALSWLHTLRKPRDKGLLTIPFVIDDAINLIAMMPFLGLDCR
jgi:hypothetical protein